MNLRPSLLALTVLLAACGGGGGSGDATITGLSIRMLSDPAAPLRYRGTALVTISGTGLAGATLSFGGNACTLADAPAGFVDGDSTRYRQCTLVRVGAQQLTVALSGGAVAQTVNLTVPQPQVTMTMISGGSTLGSFVLTLDPARAPVTVDNFLAYVGAGFYDGTVIHRHSPNFVLQGGGYAAPVSASGLPAEKPTNPPITLEDSTGLSNLRYTVAMARTAQANSATSQFFVNLADNTFLDGTGTTRGYAVFGSVTDGTALIEAMRAAPCTAVPWYGPGGDCLPVPNLVIASATQTR
jgi:cyclophilin family peptidyl-prolyl cis-trans isomerase